MFDTKLDWSFDPIGIGGTGGNSGASGNTNPAVGNNGRGFVNIAGQILGGLLGGNANQPEPKPEKKDHTTLILVGIGVIVFILIMVLIIAKLGS